MRRERRNKLTWGMMVIFERRSCSPNTAMLMLSTRMAPLEASTIRNMATVSEDLPAPVRPTIPTFVPPGMSTEMSLSTRSRPGR